MLTLTALRDPEYLISSVALALDEYYAGVGEAPGVWTGGFAKELGLQGMVDADELRALVQGHHPGTGVDLLAGRPKRRVNAFDATLSAPKSVSLLWALGSPEVASMVTRCHTEAVETALGVLQDKAAVARQQTKGVRRRVATTGFAIAAFAHRTSREGDPQLHSHCLIANVVRRLDGSCVAFDANPLHDWAKAAGSIYQAELQRLLSLRLGVEWGPEHNVCREMVGFSSEQLRAFSKRTLAIEAELEASGAVYESPAARMRADDAASLATRPKKDHSLTPSLLAERWDAEARGVGLESPEMIEAAVIRRQGMIGDLASSVLTPEDVMAGLVDPDTGLCGDDARFTEAKVVERICAASAGRLTTEQILAIATDFLASELVVRLVPETTAAGRRRPPQWSTVAHRQLEDHVLGRIAELADTPEEPLGEDCLQAALAGEGRLGDDQAHAVRELCGPGGLLRALIAPAGFGKTTAIHAAAAACTADGRPVLGLATTNQAVAGLRAVGIGAVTIARLRIDLAERRLDPGTVVILDEVSQVATRDAAFVLDAVAATPGSQLWCLGDPRQSQPVGAAGLAAEIARLGSDGAIVAPTLVVNRRQRDVVDQAALARLREGHAQASQAIRTDAGWEHEETTPLATREALADAVVADIAAYGPQAVVTLAVSHGDCEDLADRIRARLIASGAIASGTDSATTDSAVTGGDELVGPGWGSGERRYRVGDRVLLHTKPGRADWSSATKRSTLHNGSTGTVVAVGDDGLCVAFDNNRASNDDKNTEMALSRSFVQGIRGDGHPNISHAWARTIEGAQGGTWESVHLLGSANLDALVGYTGQSRGRAPTHTWNTRALVVVDHGGELADERSATEVTLAGLAREPVTTFAAADDPWILDRKLRAERDEHMAVLAQAPPDLRASLANARETARRARDAEELATKQLARAEDRLAGFGPLTGLRRSARRNRENVAAWMERASDDVEQATARRSAAEERVADLEYGEASRADFVEEHSWRAGRIKAIDDKRSGHWADAVLAAVRQDDPLAFGVDRLRAARASFANQIDALEASLPEDRTQAIERERTRLALRQRVLGEARFTADEERQNLEAVSQRRWGRRDGQAIAAAQQAVEAAEAAVVKATEHEGDCRRWLSRAVDGQRQRSAAMADAEPQMEALIEALGELDAGLDDTRAARVVAMVADADPPDHLVAVLGKPPAVAAGRQVWCALASGVESYRDRHPEALGHDGAGIMAAIGPRPGERLIPSPEWDGLAGQLRRGPALAAVAVAGQLDGPVGRVGLGDPPDWLTSLEAATAVLETQRKFVERGLGRDRGMDIGR